MTKFKTNKNKKAKAFTIKGAAALIIAAILAAALLFTGCNQPSGSSSGGNSGSSGGGGNSVDGFVTITPLANGIIGVDPDYTLPGTDAWWKGVFIKDRKVKLSPYKLGKTEVTYELWHEVLTWAESNGYTFADKGKEGSHGTVGAAPTGAKKEPVTTISWRDCIVWCNAYTAKAKPILPY